MQIFIFTISFVILQRISELIIAKRNEKQMRKLGAYEAGASHYPFMILLHAGFFISLIVEVIVFERSISPFFGYLLFLFLLVQSLRVWCLSSLGMFWNTKIIVLPGAKTVKTGPYAFFKHPNYLVVCCEIILLPMMFQAYFTAIVFTVLNLIMLSIRIPIENKALIEATNGEYTYNKKIQHPS
ncbi:isoprenylcysteine carboxyl methyltransferase family protein [Ureibacillus suwonensis]|uniref:Isoprenylcysteine carboxyl methyltransferase family protein n=1 Tax=Ureibacillus suwonensis TaxID=313007 RepID=A0ABW0RGA4_9BACL